MMTVPACKEWATCHTYTTIPCYCTVNTNKVCSDCKSCNGFGVVGLVSSLEWSEYRHIFPEYVGDTRFDPRATFGITGKLGVLPNGYVTKYYLTPLQVLFLLVCSNIMSILMYAVFRNTN